VDICQSSSTYQHEFAKGWFQYIVRDKHKILLPKYSEDTTVLVQIDDFPVEYSTSLRELDTLLGHFVIKKKYPDCVDSNIYESRIFQFMFDDFLDLNVYKSIIDSSHNFYLWEMGKENFNLTNTPRINDVNPNWQMPWPHNPDEGYFNKDSIMVDRRYCNLINSKFEGCEEYYCKKKLETVLSKYAFNDYLDTTGTVANLHQGDTLQFNGSDSSYNKFIYNKYIKLIEKEIGPFNIVFGAAVSDSTTDKIYWWHYNIFFKQYYPLKYALYLLADAGLAYKDLPFSLINYNTTIIKNELNKDPINLQLLQNQNEITINFDIQNSGHITINLMNELTQLISVLHNGNLNSGHNQITYNIANLSHGLYFIVLSDGTNTISKKFIK
jgi:hypothetical protein